MPARPQVLVDRASPVPLYYQVARQLEQAIESGALPPGSRLDNEIALAEELGLSRPTMRQAIQYLVDKGLLVRKRGVGTHVARARVRRPVGLTSLFDDLARSGQEPTTTVLAHRVEPASGVVASTLEVADGTPVVALERLRRTRGEPLAILRNHLRADIAPLDPDVLARRGLYEVLREAGVAPATANQSIGARRATAAEAELLDETRGAPLLTMRRTTFDERGVVVEFGDHLYRASRYSFEVDLTGR
ncbi:GntR family transcriptional regulator [Pseudonocardia kunmingensis]|uniref:DNA-binding GntR family transcriptional regulator n=1 Tax=Pseudonocardia kunmingensis TaxID=630975 RepID=A0A543D1H6_9PSEU|nr:GntR family transcriptional regulator [Pseudonocardia kunmingensis]TQM03187.1 DNA-binding GntR family transcriptional regulator [Pseudonocardia kunmingensis]